MSNNTGVVYFWKTVNILLSRKANHKTYLLDCHKGYSGDGNSCTDIDECATQAHACVDEPCLNRDGGYHCGESDIDIIWLVDGTGSYKGNIPAATRNLKEGVKIEKKSFFQCLKIFHTINGIFEGFYT